MTEQEFPIFLINLQRSVERREVMEGHLSELGLEYERVDAVDGSALPPELVKLYSAQSARETIGRVLLPGEIGCALSHYTIYRRILEESLDVALILEDDVVLSSHLVSVLNSAINHHHQWELLNLITDVDEELLVDSPIGFHYTFTSFKENPNRTGAYLIRSTGAKKLLENALPIRMAADTLTGDFHGSGIVLRGVFPNLATLRPLKSTFQRGNYPPKTVVWQRKVVSANLENLVTLNPLLIPSTAWIVWHTIRAYLGPLKRGLLNLLGGYRNSERHG